MGANSSDPRTVVAATALAAGAAAVGIGLTTAPPAAAQPDVPFAPTLPSKPFAAHDSASTSLLTRLPDRFLLGDPYRVVRGAFDRFVSRFGDGGLGDSGLGDTGTDTAGP